MPRPLTILLALAIALATPLALDACAHPGATAGADRDARTILRVENQSILDANIYVLHNAQRLRLGTAIGASKTSFIIPTSMIFGPTSLRFLVHPIGGSRNEVSYDIVVTPGDSVFLQIPPELGR